MDTVMMTIFVLINDFYLHPNHFNYFGYVFNDLIKGNKYETCFTASHYNYHFL